MDASNFNYDGTVPRKIHTDRSDEKRSPKFFGASLRLNTKSKIKCLEKVTLSWVMRVAAGKPCPYQGSAPCHKKVELKHG